MIPELKRTIVEEHACSLRVQHPHNPDPEARKPLEWVQPRVHLARKSDKEVSLYFEQILEENNYSEEASTWWERTYMRELRRRIAPLYVPSIYKEYLMTGPWDFEGAVREMRLQAQHGYPIARQHLDYTSRRGGRRGVKVLRGIRRTD